MNIYDAVNVYMPHSSHVDKDDLFVCPFDGVHRVAGKRFVRHILKCKKNHPHIDLEFCPYNNRHMFSREEMIIHVQRCPDNYGVEKDLGQPMVEERPEHSFGKDDEWAEEKEEESKTEKQEKVKESGKYVCQRRLDILKQKEILKQRKVEKFGLRRPKVNPMEKMYQDNLGISKTVPTALAPTFMTTGRTTA